MTAKNPLRSIYVEHIRQQKESNLSAKEYCRQNNLVEHKFVYYRDYKTAEKKTKFSEVKIQKPRRIESASTISGSMDPIWLARFLNELRF